MGVKKPASGGGRKKVTQPPIPGLAKTAIRVRACPLGKLRKRAKVLNHARLLKDVWDKTELATIAEMVHDVSDVIDYLEDQAAEEEYDGNLDKYQGVI